MPSEQPAVLRHPEFHGRIGVARKVITPPVGIYARLWGSAKHDVAEGIHRPLFASCVVLQDAAKSTQLILLAIDACVLAQEEMVSIRAALLKQFALEPHQLTLHPTHSHSVPTYSRKHVDRPGGNLILPYLDSLPVVCAEQQFRREKNIVTEGALPLQSLAVAAKPGFGEAQMQR